MTSLDWEKTSGTSSTPQATQTSVGTVMLAGDLSGSATNPTVPGLSTKASSNHTHSDTDITNASATGKSVLEAASAAAARTAISAANSTHTHVTTDVSDSTTVGRALMDAASAASARSTISAVLGTGIVEVQLITQAAYTALGGGASATTLYVIQG